MTYSLGIDIGSAFSKGVLLAETAVAASVTLASGGEYRTTARRIRDTLLARASLSGQENVFSIATGNGSSMADFAADTRIDLVCHARGIAFSCPAVRTAIDIGDMSSKAFRLDDQGNLVKFLLSGRCAGGSGRVLRIIAKVLHTEVSELSVLGRRATGRIDFHTNCAVFAESEAVSRLAEGVPQTDLVAGIHRALALQGYSLVERIGIENDFALVGGGALDSGLVAALEELTGHGITIPPDPQLTAALGAALIARELAQP